MDGLLRRRARVRHARHRRHLRCRAWSSAAVAVQRALRRTLSSCRSMSTTPRRDALSPSFCAPARRRPARRCALIYAGSCGISASVGRRPASPSGATAIMAARGDGVVRDNGLDYVFGLSGNKPLVAARSTRRRTTSAPDRAFDDRAPSCAATRETRLRSQILESASAAPRPHRGDEARPRHPLRRHQSRHGSPEWLYDSLYCARGQAENLIKLHKTQLASDRTSCRVAARQSGAARPAHRRLLADARPCATPFPNRAIWRRRRVRDVAAAADQDRARVSSRPPAACDSPSPPLSRSRSVPRPARRARPARTVNDGACAPFARPISLQRVQKVIDRQTVKKPNDRHASEIRSAPRLHAKSEAAVNRKGFRNGPLVVKSLVSTSPIYGAPRERAVDRAVASAAPAIRFRRLRRRSLASVRGRRDGRHMMPSEETASLSNHAWSV